MALLSRPENQVYVALFDKMAYGAVSAALNCALQLNLHRFNATEGAKSQQRPPKASRAGCGSVASEPEAATLTATGNEKEPVLT